MQRFDRSPEHLLSGISHGDKVVKLFVRDLRVNHYTAVDQRFQLGAHRVKINRSCKDDHIGIQHFLNYFRSGIIIDAFAFLAGVTADAGSDGFSGEGDFFYGMTVFSGTAGEVVAQGVGVAVFAGGGGDDKYLFHVMLFFPGYILT